MESRGTRKMDSIAIRHFQRNFKRTNSKTLWRISLQEVNGRMVGERGAELVMTEKYRNK